MSIDLISDDLDFLRMQKEARRLKSQIIQVSRANRGERECGNAYRVRGYLDLYSASRLSQLNRLFFSSASICKIITEYAIRRKTTLAQLRLQYTLSGLISRIDITIICNHYVGCSKK